MRGEESSDDDDEEYEYHAAGEHGDEDARYPIHDCCEHDDVETLKVRWTDPSDVTIGASDRRTVSLTLFTVRTSFIFL
jgi:hypothetical protein